MKYDTLHYTTPHYSDGLLPCDPHTAAGTYLQHHMAVQPHRGWQVWEQVCVCVTLGVTLVSPIHTTQTMCFAISLLIRLHVESQPWEPTALPLPQTCAAIAALQCSSINDLHCSLGSYRAVLPKCVLLLYCYCYCTGLKRTAWSHWQQMVVCWYGSGTSLRCHCMGKSGTPSLLAAFGAGSAIQRQHQHVAASGTASCVVLHYYAWYCTLCV